MPITLTAEQADAIKNMPGLSHYPDRSEKFDFRKSEVIAFFQTVLGCDLTAAVRQFERSRRAKRICFDPVEKQWVGCKRMSPQQLSDEG